MKPVSGEIFFSVIIPCFNAERSIEQCLQSCIRQSYRNFEVIVVDDGSHDSSKSIVSARKDDFLAEGLDLRLITLPVNSGQAFARNTGWENARGDFVAFLDADDCWHADKLLVVSHFLSSYPDIDLLAHRYTQTQSQNFQTRCYPSAFKLKGVSFKRLLLQNISACPCWVARTSLHERFDASMRFSEDRDLWVRIAFSHRCAVVNGPPLTLLGRPQHSPGGVSASRIRLRLGEMTVYAHVAKYAPTIIPVLPILVIYSLLKACRREILLWWQNFYS